MTATFRIESEAATDTGTVREFNEDSFLVRPDLGLWVVADGMGGHQAGDLASRTLVEELDRLEPAASAPALLTALEGRVIHANARLRDAARARGARAVVGCTLAALVIFEGAFACIWSGDSRIYRIRQGAIAQVTRDHTEAQELVDRGTLTAEEAQSWPRRNVLTRAIGVFDEPELEMAQGRLEDGDVFVICSDGLTHHLGDEEIGQLANLRPLRLAVERMIATTLERGATDNVTVVTVACREVTAVRSGAAPTQRGDT
jgi:serine/threonine protein phosphatase PrpC